MSCGPTRACVKCNAPLDLTDPRNGGYCGGHMCMADPRYVAPAPYDFSAAPKRKPRLQGTRKQRRAAESKARRAKR